MKIKPDTYYLVRLPVDGFYPKGETYLTIVRTERTDEGIQAWVTGTGFPRKLFPEQVVCAINLDAMAEMYEETA